MFNSLNTTDMKKSSTRQACVRLRALGLPAHITNELIALFQKWTRESGKEWTVSRLKALKQELISRRSGGFYRAPYIARNRKDGLPKGTMHFIFKRALSSDKHFRMMLNVLMVYSTLKLEQVSETQKKKFFGSMMSSSRVGLDARPRYVPVPDKPVRVLNFFSKEPKLGRLCLPKPKVFLEFCTSPSKVAPSLLAKSIRQDDSLGQFLFFLNSKPCQEALESFPNVFKYVIPWHYVHQYRRSVRSSGLVMRTSNWRPRSLFACRHSVGKIGLIQEPGCKLRAVAVLNAVLQAALQPLKSLILEDLRFNFPSDCTHDQVMGVTKIQSWLKQGRTCYSVDLSDATNMFPLPYQVSVLKGRYCHGHSSELMKEYIECFEFISKSQYYYVDEEKHVQCLSFTRGQPLGAGPSFPTFALSHNILLLGLCRNVVGCDPWDSFRILGDDIVISNEELHEHYLCTLKNLGCPVSESKCLTSKEMAEFAGYVIMKDQFFHPYKWTIPDWDNFVSLAQEYGPKSLQLVNGAKRSILKFLGPIPESIGGFGWNSKGLPLSERLQSEAVSRFIEAGVQTNTSTLYRTLTSLVERFHKASLERGLTSPSFPTNARMGLYDVVGDVPSRNTDEYGWSNPVVRLSMEEKRWSINRHLRAERDDGTFLGDFLEPGYFTNWVKGYGQVVRAGEVPFDPSDSVSEGRKEAILYWMKARPFDKHVIEEAEKHFSKRKPRQVPAPTMDALERLSDQALPHDMEDEISSEEEVEEGRIFRRHL